MNSIRRALAAERKRLLKLSPTSLLQHQHQHQHQHVSSFSTTTTKHNSRTLNSSKTRASKTPPLPKPHPLLNLNDAVPKEPEPVTWTKPSEIPWQAKVVNSVNLIGRVKIPVQFEASSDGKSWAGTIISQDDGSESAGSLTSFWIPVIFEGDMAHIAMCHLKEKDYVHVAGHLSVDVPPFKLSEVQANVQVMAHSINFVQKFQSNKPSTSGELDRFTTKNSGISENNVFPQQSLKEPDYPVHNSNEMTRLQNDNKHKIQASWRDLVTNPTQWLDNRENKRKGLLKASYPDFKHKETRAGLWLDNAPVGVLQGLGQLEFLNTAGKVKDGDSWKHLIENPGRWWDNRADKKNQKGPDFKSKDSGKALWLSDAPSWAVSSLPPLKDKTVDESTKEKWASY